MPAASPDASRRQADTARFTASEVTVAPATPSTSTELASTMAAGTSCMATVPMPAVSFSPSAATCRMLSSLTSTVTVTSPPLPRVVAV